MEPHGFIETQWLQNVLIVRAYGPFNIEGITVASSQIKQTVAEKQFDVWHRVDYLDPLTLGSPDVMKIIGRSYKWSNYLSSCQNVAVCCSTLLQYQKMKFFVDHDRLNIAVFDCLDQADNFINDLL